MSAAHVIYVFVGEEDRVGVREGELDGIFVGRGETVGRREGRLDEVGLEDDVGMTDILGDAVGEPSSHTGTSQYSIYQYPPYSVTTAPV